MNILSIRVLLTEATDQIQIHTDLPAATYPFAGKQMISFEAAKDSGVEYVRQHFSCEPEILNVRANANT